MVSLLLPFTKLPKVWYHNHDVFPLEFYKKYSVNWFGAHTELRLVRKVNYLSLPANERKEHFNLKGFKGKYFFIPNYPSQYIHGNINIRKRIIDNQIRLIYPGNICHKHGFEELIKILCKKVSEKEIHLTLLGDIQEDYRKELIEIVKSINSLDKLHFISRKSYFEIPDILQGHHIGWAVNKPLDVTYSTGGTAANKIYEFIAMGMPVLLYDNDHYKSHLGHLESAFFTDLSEASLMKQIQMIIEDYDKYSKSSRSAFVNNFTFESAFNNAAKEVIREIED